MDPARRRFRYTKINRLSCMRSRIFSSKANIKQTNQKRYNYVYNVAIFLCIALADKGYIGDFNV